MRLCGSIDSGIRQHCNSYNTALRVCLRDKTVQVIKSYRVVLHNMLFHRHLEIKSVSSEFNRPGRVKRQTPQTGSRHSVIT